MVLTSASVGWSSCLLWTVQCHFARFWNYLSVREVPQLGNVMETPSAQSGKICAPGSHCCLCNCSYILRRFIQRNTKCVHTFLKWFPVVQELHMENQHLYMCIHHRCKFCHQNVFVSVWIQWRCRYVLQDAVCTLCESLPGARGKFVCPVCPVFTEWSSRDLLATECCPWACSEGEN